MDWGRGGERKYKSRERTKELGVGCVLNNAATAKVQNPNPWNCRTGLHQKVLWLNISVEDTPRVEIDHGLNQLPQNDLQKEKETERKMTFTNSSLEVDGCDELVCTHSPWPDPQIGRAHV